MTISKIRRRDLLALLGASPLISLSQAAAAAPQKRGGTLVIGYTQTPRHLNGAVQSGYATALASTQLFASPLRYDDQWRPHPYLAKRWDFSKDGKTLTLYLRDDAVFHDGHPITAEDFAYTINVIKANHPFKTMMESVDAVEIANPHTAIIRTSKPAPALLLAMSPPLCPILPKHIYDNGADIKSNPRNSRDVVGSGPFVWQEFTPGQRIVMRRFEKFFIPEHPYLDRVVIDLNPNTALEVLALEKSGIDAVTFLTVPTELERLSKNSEINVSQKGYEGQGALNWIEFNCAKEPLTDPAVRRAISMSMDKDFVTKKLMGGVAQRADGPIAPSSPFYSTKDVFIYKYDLKAAAELLDKAGYKEKNNRSRFKITMDYMPGDDTQGKAVAEYMVQQLKKLKIDAQLRASADFPSWAKRMAEHDFDMSTNYVANWGDPTIGVARTYLSSNIKPVVWTNNTSYKNLEVDKLLEQAGHEMDVEKRKALYGEFQRIITNDVPILFVDVVPFHTAARKNINNLPDNIWGMLSPYDEVSKN